MIPAIGEVFEVVKDHGRSATGATLALYHDSDGGIDVEMAVVLAAPATPQQYGSVTVKELPAADVASVVYGGSFDAFEAVGQLHADIGRWMEANGYRVGGASRELYLQPPKDYSQDGVMEIQYPVTPS